MVNHGTGNLIRIQIPRFLFSISSFDSIQVDSVIIFPRLLNLSKTSGWDYPRDLVLCRKTHVSATLNPRSRNKKTLHLFCIREKIITFAVKMSALILCRPWQTLTRRTKRTLTGWFLVFFLVFLSKRGGKDEMCLFANARAMAKEFVAQRTKKTI